MPMVAQKSPYTLFILDDDNAQSPREDRDNFGAMSCWHSRYNLGDKHNYADSAELFRELIDGQIPAMDIVNFAKDGKADGVKLEYNRGNNEWELNAYSDYLKQWFTAATFEAPLKGKESDVAEYILENLRDADLKELAEKCSVILPLYLYDHSGITISTSPFSCPWDSGQVGWVYATHNKTKEEYGDASPENLEKAESLMRSEALEYDYYLTGQSYGFKLYNGQNEIDSCWGFLGQISDVSNAIKQINSNQILRQGKSAQFVFLLLMLFVMFWIISQGICSNISGLLMKQQRIKFCLERAFPPAKPTKTAMLSL